MFKSTSTKRERDATRCGIIHFLNGTGKTLEEIAQKFGITPGSAGNFLRGLVVNKRCEFNETTRLYKKFPRRKNPGAYKTVPPHKMKAHHHSTTVTTPAVVDDDSPPWRVD